MERIVLNGIRILDNVISFDFTATDGLKGFFSDTPFSIEYPESMDAVPYGVAAVPFVCNVLPLIWLTDSELVLDEIDQAFYDSIPDFKAGYIKMFPKASFKGKITAGAIRDFSYPDEGKCATFFSGGLDSIHTLISHYDEHPTLITIWGSDIRPDNVEGWNKLEPVLKNVADTLNLEQVVFRSTFRVYENEGVLHTAFFQILKDGWWHGVKHGIGLLGHIAPYAYKKHLSTFYIASTYSVYYPAKTCASDPSIDNYVRFCGCKVIHDGYEFSRQDKIHNLIAYCERTGRTIPVHVCWESKNGENCCRCEKCYRTMAGFFAEGRDPREYGWNYPDNVLTEMRTAIENGAIEPHVLRRHLPGVKKRAEENRELLAAKPYWDDFKWILDADFEHPERMIHTRIRIRMCFKRLLKMLYKFLHKIKDWITQKNT